MTEISLNERIEAKLQKLRDNKPDVPYVAPEPKTHLEKLHASQTKEFEDMTKEEYRQYKREELQARLRDVEENYHEDFWPDLYNACYEAWKD